MKIILQKVEIHKIFRDITKNKIFCFYYYFSKKIKILLPTKKKF